MRDVGPLLGLPHSWVQKTESGERRLDVAEYVRLCHVLGADPGEGLGVVEANLGPYTPAADASLKAADGRPRYRTKGGKSPTADGSPSG